MKEDNTPISPQYLFDIEMHHRVPAPHILRELSRVLELDYDTLPILAGTVDTVVRDYLEEHPHLVHILVEPELLQQVQDAAEAHGVSVAAWLRQAMRQVTTEGFPASWRADDARRRGGKAGRAHNSRACGKRLMRRFDEQTWERLDHLTRTFEQASAEVIRQLIVQAKPESFPESWHLAVPERRNQPRSTEGWGGSRS